jgi:hypothetical protein
VSPTYSHSTPHDQPIVELHPSDLPQISTIDLPARRSLEDSGVVHRAAVIVYANTLSTCNQCWKHRRAGTSGYRDLLQLIALRHPPLFLTAAILNVLSKPYSLSTDTRYTTMRVITYLCRECIGHTLLLTQTTEAHRAARLARHKTLLIMFLFGKRLSAL